MSHLLSIIFLGISLISLCILIWCLLLNYINKNKILKNKKISKANRKNTHKKLNQYFPEQQHSKHKTLIYTIFSFTILIFLVEYSLRIPTKFLWIFDILLLLTGYIFYSCGIATFKKKQVLYQYAAQDQTSLFSENEKKYFDEMLVFLAKTTNLFNKWGFITLLTCVLSVIFNH